MDGCFKVRWKSSKTKYHEKLTVFVEISASVVKGIKVRIFCNQTIKLTKICLHVHVLQLDVHHLVSTL